jgi:hypothetical protein
MISIYARLVSYACALIALAGVLWALHQHGDRQGAARVTAQWQAEKTAQAETMLKARIAADNRMAQADQALAAAKARPPEIITEIIRTIKNEKTPTDCKPSDDLVRVLNF